MGDEAKDIITGFIGIIITRCEYITGCDTYGIKPKIDKEGKEMDALWIDEGRVKIIGKGINKKEVKADKGNGASNEYPPI